MAKPSVYIETLIVSYLAARPSANLLTAACQQITTEWWEGQRHLYDLFTSELVIAEAKAGDVDAVGRRLDLLRGIAELTISDDVRRLAVAFIAQGALPDKAQADAIHIAVAAVHNVDYLLTWNCRHIGNPATKPAVRAVCTREGIAVRKYARPLRLWRLSPMKDEILREVWRSRDEFAKRHNYDIEAMVATLRKMERHPWSTVTDRSKEKPKKRLRKDPASGGR